MLLSIVVAVLVLAILIIVHEAGHFVVAKKAGVRILRFSIGYPPRIWGIRRGETDYAIGLTPFGGYVRMLGDEIGDESGAEDLHSYLHEIELDLIEARKQASIAEGDARRGTKNTALVRTELTEIATQYAKSGGGDEAEALAKRYFGRALSSEEAILLEEAGHSGSLETAIERLNQRKPERLMQSFRERAFPSQSLAKRFAIVLAGPAANILFAPLLLTVVYLHGVPYLKPVLGTVEQGTPAAAAGLRPGDTVVKINGKPVSTWDDLSTTVKRSHGATLSLIVDRQAGDSVQHLTIRVSPRLKGSKDEASGGVWIIGVMPRGDEGLQRVGLLRAFQQAVVQTGHMASSLIVGIVRIIDGSTPVRQALGGPIMIAQLAGREAHQGFTNLALFMVMLSLELGIINLLPVPMLDGGHLLFFVFEAFRGKPLKLRHREIAQQVGLLLLVALMAFVIFNDISRIVQHS
jgi:regulator of sigma E protease